MPTEWNGDALMDALKREAATGLIAAAVLYANALAIKVSRPSPFTTHRRQATRTMKDGTVFKKGTVYRIYYDPSKQGEYPKLRTGAGQKSITIGCNGRVFDVKRGPAISEVLAAPELAVQVGYEMPNQHLLALEFAQHRKGLIDLLDEMQPQLSAMVTAGFRNDT
jgi:hypothetical protein